MSRPSVLVLSGVLLLAGCGGGHDYGKTGLIRGTLTMDGKPLDGYVVNFMEPIKGYLAFGVSNELGRFVVNTWNEGNMPVGTYRVFIALPMDASENMTPEQRMNAPAQRAPKPKLPIPKKYMDQTTSGLQFDIKEGPNSFEVKLESGK